MSPGDPLVDATIAVHSASRPIARAVASIVDHTKAPVRVNVVAHNIDPDIIRTHLGPYADHPQVRLLSLQDGIHSPAGPMNHGFEHSTAPFLTLLGSDDELAPGALDSWLALQRQTHADAVLPRIVILGRPTTPLPPIRTRTGARAVLLSARRDRLSYRSAPLALIDRARFGHLRFTEGIGSGEDIAVSAELWFASRRIAVDRKGPAYLGHEDAGDRVTSALRTVPEDFAFLDAVDEAPWFRRMSRADRTALVSKLLRIQFLGAITARRETIAEHTDDLRRVLTRLRRMAPRALSVLSRVDRKIIDEALSSAPDPGRILELAQERWNSRSLGVLLTRNPLFSLHAQAMLRLLRDADRIGEE
ncbi:hypothetical protein J2Y69_000901 [Microbacterium resistens]|uniref:Glycosyltransferase 2-like domain-containing protein n=1 Tax=Microbacterium resistens TaxID=156977 RepID=A0ABU1S9M0_9MICO|nr:glycosyltransferase family A protein [Microbacterium resistens]MDR6866309.1 hypothetical protein [Microbacterium resistens]